jgi:FkbM family methyltransferase
MRFGKARWRVGLAYWHADYLRRLGFQPRTVIDVGVATGTPPLYEAWPGAFLALVEPLDDFSKAIESILAKRPGRWFHAAAGSAEGELEIRVEPVWKERSSFFARNESERTGDEAMLRKVRVATLDSIVQEGALSPPFGLKIDAEGAELEVIRGASATLRDTQFVIAEVGVAPRFEGGYRFAEFIAAMDEAGFSVCDILDLGRAGSVVTFFDLVFRRNELVS